MRKVLLKLVADRGLRFEAAELRHWDGASVSIDRGCTLQDIGDIMMLLLTPRTPCEHRVKDLTR